MTALGVDATALFRDHPTGVDRSARGWVTGLAEVRPQWRLELAGWRGTDQHTSPLGLARPAELHVAPLPRYAYRVAELGRVPLPIDALAGVGSVDAWFFPDFARLPLLRSRPSVTVVHDLSFLIPERFSHRMHRSYLSRQVARALRTSQVAVVSKFVAGELVTRYGVASSKVVVLPNAVDHLRFRPSRPDVVATAKQTLGLDRPYLVSVGALHARKNLLRLINAFAALGETAAGLDLLLIGSTNAHSSQVLEAVARYPGPGRVRHLGFVPDETLPAIYTGAELAVIPSLYEGFGLPVLEAMACGTPVLTSSGGALQEVGGDAAAYVDPRDVGSISGGLRRLLAEPAFRQELAAAGSERAADFTWQRAGNVLAELIENLL